MPEQLYNLFFAILPLVTAGISFLSKKFYEIEIAGLDEWKNNYVTLLDSVATHKTCKECKKDKKSACKHGKNQKDEILKAIDNTRKSLTRIKDRSLNLVFLFSILSVIYVVLWVIFSYEKFSFEEYFGKYYFFIFLPLFILIMFYLCFMVYKFYRKIRINLRSKKHYCKEIIELVEKEQETLSSVKMENI